MQSKQSARTYLTQAAIELFSQDKIENVSVKDICSHCGLSTRTFYNYYKDKYDLINNCFEQELEDYFSGAGHPLGLYDFFTYTADLIAGRLPFFTKVFQYTGQNNIRQGLELPIQRWYLRIIESSFQATITPQIRDAVSFFVLGQLAYIEEALKLPDIPSTIQSVAYFENAIPAVLQPYLYAPRLP